MNDTLTLNIEVLLDLPANNVNTLIYTDFKLQFHDLGETNPQNKFILHLAIIQ